MGYYGHSQTFFQIPGCSVTQLGRNSLLRFQFVLFIVVITHNTASKNIKHRQKFEFLCLRSFCACQTTADFSFVFESSNTVVPYTTGPGLKPVKSYVPYALSCIIVYMFCVCVCVYMHMHACSAMSNSLRPHGLQPARLLCPWNFPGKHTGVGCHSYHRGSSQPRD